MDNRFPRINPTTKSLADEKFRWLAEHFPEAVTESYDGEGRLVRAIDKEKLMQDIAHYVVDGPKERYQFTWPGKKEAILTANAPIARALRPCKEESVDFDKTGNLYIEGDNLDVLKSLRDVYLGKVKMIYIDPPYNTGNDMVYEDDFAQSMEDYKEINGERDEDENRLFPNTESNGRFHTDWLNMIYPRLKIARDFLSDDGVIFISIDDNELANLRKICDEIFGATNFIATINCRRGGGRQDSKYYAIVQEYILCYARNAVLFQAGEEIKQGDVYPFYDEKLKRFYKTQLLRKWGANSLRENRPNLYYPIKGPDGTDVYPTIYVEATGPATLNRKIQGRWRWSASTLEKALQEGRVEFHKNKKFNEWVAYEKIFAPLEGEAKTKKYTTWMDDVGNGTPTIKELFSSSIFDYSKSPELILRFLKMADLKDNDFVLDFFSGSATTAHATMQLNAEDGGSRKFIMVQLPEVCEPDSEAYKAGYKNICEIGKERIRRAGKKIRDDLQSSIDRAKAKLTKLEEDQKKKPELFGGGKTSFETMDALRVEIREKTERLASLDTGFRVLKCDSPNERDVSFAITGVPPAKKDLFDAVGNIKADRTELDLLFEAMLAHNCLLSSAIETVTIEGHTVYSVEHGHLVACFEADLPESLIREVATRQWSPAGTPISFFIMRDSSYRDDSMAANFEQIFRHFSPDTTAEVL